MILNVELNLTTTFQKLIVKSGTNFVHMCPIESDLYFWSDLETPVYLSLKDDGWAMGRIGPSHGPLGANPLNFRCILQHVSSVGN